MYRVFTRTWWAENLSYPNGLEPHPGRKHTLARDLTEAEAYSMCQEWNANHKPSRLSRKAEYEEQ